MPKSEDCFLDQESWIKARTLNPQKLGYDVWADCYRQLVKQQKQGQDAKISAGRRLKMLCDFLELHGIARSLPDNIFPSPKPAVWPKLFLTISVPDASRSVRPHRFAPLSLGTTTAG